MEDTDGLSSAPSTSSSALLDNLLSYPATSTEQNQQAEPPTNRQDESRQLLKDRLYIGNLHPSVDEYTLLQIFSKFGKVTKLDFLFHKTGLLKGKPRGYAFIEYQNEDDALKALTIYHDKLLRGRRLVVTYAHQAPLDQTGAPSPYGTGVKHRKGMMETGRPTTLSMLKTGMGSRHGTEDKIAKMEAKLRQMESTNPQPAKVPQGNTSTSPSAQLHAPVPIHPSLPMRPSAPIPANSNLTGRKAVPKTKTQLPSLPFIQGLGKPSPNPPPVSNSPTPFQQRSGHAKPKLIGVKIKQKVKDNPPASETPEHHDS